MKTLLIMLGIGMLTGCGSITMQDVNEYQGMVSITGNNPEWVNSLGEFKENHPEMNKKYLIVVGTSLPIDSQSLEQLAEKTAYDNAIDNVIRELGFIVTSTSNGSITTVYNGNKIKINGENINNKVEESGNKLLNIRTYAWETYMIKEYAYDDVKSTTVIGKKTYNEINTRIKINRKYIKKGLFLLNRDAINMDKQVLINKLLQLKYN